MCNCEGSMSIQNPVTGARLVVNGELSIDESQFFRSNPKEQCANQEPLTRAECAQMIQDALSSRREVALVVDDASFGGIHKGRYSEKPAAPSGLKAFISRLGDVRRRVQSLPS